MPTGDPRGRYYQRHEFSFYRGGPGYPGQSEFWMICTKSPRTKPGMKWASTSSFIVPKVVPGRS